MLEVISNEQSCKFFSIRYEFYLNKRSWCYVTDNIVIRTKSAIIFVLTLQSTYLMSFHVLLQCDFLMSLNITTGM